MLTIVIPSRELWDEELQEFKFSEETTLNFEHSLVSLSKWESKYCKPFLKKDEKTTEEILDYIKMMNVDENVDPYTYNLLTSENIKAINDYISAPMTATTFGNKKDSGTSREIITSELIYYWMVTLTIPFECQYWHLNRLITLIRVCEIKNAPPKKMSSRELMSRNSALNAARRKQMNSKG